MAAAYHGGLPGADQYAKNSIIFTAISKAMDWWFARDFTNIACLDAGGTASCPCNTLETHMWNTNWYDNVGTSPSFPERMLMYS